MKCGMNWVVWGITVTVAMVDVAPASACMFGRRRPVTTTANYQAPTVSFFQPPCSSCGVAPAVAVAAPAPVMAVAPVVAMAAPAPIAVQETRMVQRCYLAPVTTMQTQTALENVTTMRTEFFDEAVTTMQTSAYFDPCGCGYKAVTTPVTTTVRRSRTVPVTQTIARNYVVPVTRMEQRFYMEPVTETRMYMPPTPVVAVAAAPAVAVTSNFVAPVAQMAAVPVPAAPTVANFVAPTPAPAQMMAVPGGPAPVAAVPGAQPQMMVPPQQAAPGTPQPQPGAPPQFYQTPNQAAPADNRTLIIERVIQNGAVTQENKRYLNPGEAIPPPQQPAPAGSAPATPSAEPNIEPKPMDESSRWQPTTPVRPIPVGRSTDNYSPASASVIPVSANAFYR